MFLLNKKRKQTDETTGMDTSGKNKIIENKSDSVSQEVINAQVQPAPSPVVGIPKVEQVQPAPSPVMHGNKND